MKNHKNRFHSSEVAQIQIPANKENVKNDMKKVKSEKIDKPKLDKKFHCEKCAKFYRSKRALEYHQKSSHNEEPKQYKCDISQ